MDRREPTRFSEPAPRPTYLGANAGSRPSLPPGTRYIRGCGFARALAVAGSLSGYFVEQIHSEAGFRKRDDSSGRRVLSGHPQRLVFSGGDPMQVLPLPRRCLPPVWRAARVGHRSLVRPRSNPSNYRNCEQMPGVVVLLLQKTRMFGPDNPMEWLTCSIDAAFC